MNKLQKIKNSIKKFVTSPRFSSLALMLLVGTVACLAQNTAGNYEAGTAALTTVTEEIAKYVPIETVSSMLGHKSIKTTQIYAKITKEKLNQDMENLAARLNGVEEFAGCTI